MSIRNLIEKIEEKGLVGRGGACFPVAFKWRSVRDSQVNTKYVVCNAAEGEPGVFKDGYILEDHADRVVDGINLAMDLLKADLAYIYISRPYYNEYYDIIKNKFNHYPIEFFIKPHEAGYIGGEETSILNIIEGKRAEPRLRPPFPPDSGLWGCPTLIHNVETFYNISLVNDGKFQGHRFYSINQDCYYPGVYELSSDLTIEKVLKKTGNYPEYNFFVQVGGDASGEVLNDKQLKKKVSGAGSITVYKADKYKPRKLLEDWLDFFLRESCGKCTPCREGIYRAKEILNAPKPDWTLFYELVHNLNVTSFCGLGCAASFPLNSYIKNVLGAGYSPHREISRKEVDQICHCFK